MTFRHPTERLQIAEGRRPHAKTIGISGLAVADDKVPELAFWRLDRVIRLASKRLDETRHLAHDRPFGNALRRLADDAQRLAELLEANEIPVVGVTDGPDRHVEFHFVVRRVRFVLANVARHAGPSQRRTAQ